MEKLILQKLESDINYIFFKNAIRNKLKKNPSLPIMGIYYYDGKIYILYNELDYAKGFKGGRGANEYNTLNRLIDTINLVSQDLKFELKNCDYMSSTLQLDDYEKIQQNKEKKQIQEGIILYEPEPKLPLSSLIYDKQAVKLSEEEKEEIKKLIQFLSLYNETIAIHISVTYQEENPIIHLSIILSNDSNEVLNEIIKRYQQSSKRIIFENFVIGIDQLSELGNRDLLTLYDKNGILTLTSKEEVEEKKKVIPITNVDELYGTIPLHYKKLCK